MCLWSVGSLLRCQNGLLLSYHGCGSLHDVCCTLGSCGSLASQVGRIFCSPCLLCNLLPQGIVCDSHVIITWCVSLYMLYHDNMSCGMQTHVITQSVVTLYIHINAACHAGYTTIAAHQAPNTQRKARCACPDHTCGSCLDH